jgi:hypothetical protein
MDGYQIPLEFNNGLPYCHFQKPTDNELSLLPNIIMTLDVTWNPSLYDNINDNIDQLYDPLEDTPEHEYHFNQHGEYQNHTVAIHTIVPEEEFFDAIEYVNFDDLVDELMNSWICCIQEVIALYKLSISLMLQKSN